MYTGNLAMSECSNNLQERYEAICGLGEKICKILADEVRKIGLPEKAIDTAPWKRIRFELQQDPASGESSLSGVWTNSDGHRVGNIVFHCDGTFFAEYDVIAQHPEDDRWFVEAVNAWGKNDTIKSELRLLPALV